MRILLAFLGALVVFILCVSEDGAKTSGHYAGLVVLPAIVFFAIYFLMKNINENGDEEKTTGPHNGGAAPVTKPKPQQKLIDISTIIKPGGFYAANYKKVVSSQIRFSFIFLFFLEEYIYLENIQVEEEVTVEQDFIDAMLETVEELGEELSSNSLDFEKYKFNLSEFEIIDNTIVAEYADGKSDTLRLILFNNLLSKDLRMNIEIEGIHYDLFDSTKSGFKNVKVVENAKVKYYEF